MESAGTLDLGPRAELLFAFCRMQLPSVALTVDVCKRHLERTFRLFTQKAEATWDTYLDQLYPIELRHLASACLENNRPGVGGSLRGPGRTQPIACFSTLSGLGRFGSIRATRNGRTPRSANSGRSSSLPMFPADCRFSAVTTANGRWCHVPADPRLPELAHLAAPQAIPASRARSPTTEGRACRRPIRGAATLASARRSSRPPMNGSTPLTTRRSCSWACVSAIRLSQARRWRRCSRSTRGRSPGEPDHVRDQ